MNWLTPADFLLEIIPLFSKNGDGEPTCGKWLRLARIK